MNFVEEYKRGQKGENMGIDMGPGLGHLNSTIYGVQKGRKYVIAAPPKAGKTSLIDYGWVIHPYLEMLENPKIDIDWQYFSWEIDIISKQNEFAVYFLSRDYNLTHIELEKGTTLKGESIIPLSSAYLRGKIKSDQKELIKVKPRVEEVLKEIYRDRLVLLFGEYSDKGDLITPGKIEFIEEKSTPEEINGYLKQKARKSGRFITKPWNGKERIIGYEPIDPNKFTIVIVDHVRAIKKGVGHRDLKSAIDDYSKYTTEIRNICNYTFVDIIHINRNFDTVERKKFAGDKLYPIGSDIKDTGNLAEDADYLITMFNPNLPEYNLRKHFGLELRGTKGDPYYPDLRTLHLAYSRHCEFPQHFSVLFRGAWKDFELFNKNDNE